LRNWKQHASQTSSSTTKVDRDRHRVEIGVAGWSWIPPHDAVNEEQDLMMKRTWAQPVIPPPFPTIQPPNSATQSFATQNSATQKVTQKAAKVVPLSKAHLAQHKRNLTQISHSYISPDYSKNEVKRARKTPTSDSDEHSSISRITTISGMSSTSSENSTDDQSSSEESDSNSGPSASGSDFFTKYANKGGPTSVDDIFKRTLQKQQLEYNLNRIKETKEQEEIEQLGDIRGREGATPPPLDKGDNAKVAEKVVTQSVSDYDMCSDADEVKELWKQCFPEVDFWETNRKKKFKKRKILF
jgi:hypothetical protein